MRRLNIISVVITLLLLLEVASAGAQPFSQRFAKGQSTFGFQAGFGFTVDIPPGRDRTDLSFLFFFPNYQYNLTGLIGKSWYQGAWNWHVEAGIAEVLNRGGEYLLGFSPLMAEYQVLNPQRRWAPNILLGAGFAMTNWKDVAERELGSEFQFLLHAGAGVEVFFDDG